MSDVDKKKCCACGKEIDISTSQIPPIWFGCYKGSNELVKIICINCIKQCRENWTEKYK